MRTLIAALPIAAALSIALTGVAAGAEPAHPANGIYIALDGTTDSGEFAAASEPLVDPELARCYDLVTADGDTAAWNDSVNRTDRVALLSGDNCMGTVGADPSKRVEVEPGDTARSHFQVRSVSFSSIP